MRLQSGPAIAVAVVVGLHAFAAPPIASAQDNLQGNADPVEEIAEDSVTSYGPDFFAQFPTAITALDIINRIPLGPGILESSSSNNRGFSSNDDRILINGNRLAGKNNDSESALGRITLNQLERIDIIRGGAPEFGVFSSEPVMNIILGSQDRSVTGSWQAGAAFTWGPHVQFGAFLALGGSLGNFNYSISADRTPKDGHIIQSERSFDGENIFTGRLDEVIVRSSREHKYAGNFAYRFEGGQILRLNGLYVDDDTTEVSDGTLFGPNGTGDPGFVGNSARLVRTPRPNYEIGGDFEADFSGNFTFKALALYSVSDTTFVQREDFLITVDNPEDDFLFSDDSRATEAIGRIALTWQATPRQSIEFGTEEAINEQRVDLDFFENDGSGNLVEVFIPASDTLIKEVRNESFINHSWKISDTLNLDSSIFMENFTISQTGVGVDARRSFMLFRPSFDLRIDLTDQDQLQLAVTRNVRQLNFRHFASSASDDDEVVAGNTLLVPEKNWQFGVSLEHRLADDGGRVKLLARYDQISDLRQRIEVSPGVSGVGNIGNASRIFIELDASVRLGFLNLPDVLFEALMAYSDSKVTDPFSGVVRHFNFNNHWWVVYSLRHEVADWDFSYGGTLDHYSVYSFHDIDEVSNFPKTLLATIFLEKNLFGAATLRFEASNLFDHNVGRERTLFDGGTAGGIVTSSILRDRFEGRQFRLSLKATF